MFGIGGQPKGVPLLQMLQNAKVSSDPRRCDDYYKTTKVRVTANPAGLFTKSLALTLSAIYHNFYSHEKVIVPVIFAPLGEKKRKDYPETIGDFLSLGYTVNIYGVQISSRRDIQNNAKKLLQILFNNGFLDGEQLRKLSIVWPAVIDYLLDLPFYYYINLSQIIRELHNFAKHHHTELTLYPVAYTLPNRADWKLELAKLIQNYYAVIGKKAQNKNYIVKITYKTAPKKKGYNPQTLTISPKNVMAALKVLSNKGVILEIPPILEWFGVVYFLTQYQIVGFLNHPFIPRNLAEIFVDTVRYARQSNPTALEYICLEETIDSKTGVELMIDLLKKVGFII